MPGFVSAASMAALLFGVASGILAGMFGVGGAVLTTPAIRLLGATPIEGVGSTVPAILPGAISGAFRYARAGLVDWRVGLVCGLTGGLSATAGARVSGLVDGHYLMVSTAGLMAFSGISLIRSSRRTRELDRVPAAGPEGDFAEGLPPHVDPAGVAAGTEMSTPVLMLIGAGAGWVAGLLGVGGGIVMIPAFTRWLRLPMKVAVGSSLVAIAIFSIPALITHAYYGHIAWRFAVPLVIGVVPGAQLGARLSFAASDTMVRRLFGWSVLAMSVMFAIIETLGLRR